MTSLPTDTMFSHLGSTTTQKANVVGTRQPGAGSVKGSGWRLLREQTRQLQSSRRGSLQRHGADGSGREPSLARRAKSGVSLTKGRRIVEEEGGDRADSSLVRASSSPHKPWTPGAVEFDGNAEFSEEQFTGTALIFAWLAIAGLGSLEKIASRQRLTAQLYRNHCVLSHDLDDMIDKFKVRISLRRHGFWRVGLGRSPCAGAGYCMTVTRTRRQRWLRS